MQGYTMGKTERKCKLRKWKKKERRKRQREKPSVRNMEDYTATNSSRLHLHNLLEVGETITLSVCKVHVISCLHNNGFCHPERCRCVEHVTRREEMKSAVNVFTLGGSAIWAWYRRAWRVPAWPSAHLSNVSHKWDIQIKSKFTVATRFNSSSVKNTEPKPETAPHYRTPRELLIELNNTLMTSSFVTQGKSVLKCGVYKVLT